jgi:hypothetical protein
MIKNSRRRQKEAESQNYGRWKAVKKRRHCASVTGKVPSN